MRGQQPFVEQAVGSFVVTGDAADEVVKGHRQWCDFLLKAETRWYREEIRVPSWWNCSCRYPAQFE